MYGEAEKQWREALKTEGICISCAKEPVSVRKGKKLSRCEKCISWRKVNRPKQKSLYACRDCGNPASSVRCKPCWEALRSTYPKLTRRDVWQRIFEFYGDICSCCGETEKLFLSIDHINRGGRQARESIYDYARTKRDDLRILCMNCNWGRERNGGVCPHAS